MGLPALLLTFQVYISLQTTRGLDLTDESYYMASMIFADHYRYGASSFGALYAIFLEVLGGNWGYLRIGMSWLNWFLGLAFFWSLFGLLGRWNLLNVSERGKITWAFFGAALSSLTLHLWLPTPSYNTAVWQGSMIFAVGLIQMHSRGKFAFANLALGLTIAFMGKPTTSAALVILLAVNTWNFGARKALGFLSICGATFLFFIGLWAIYLDQSVVSYADRLIGGAALTSTLALGEPPIEINPIWALGTAFWPFSGMSLTSLLFATISLVALVASVTLSMRGNRGSSSNTGIQIAILMTITFSVTASFWEQPDGLGGILLMGVFIGTLLSGYFVHRNKLVTILQQGIGADRGMAPGLVIVTFFALPLTTSLGSNNNYIQHSVSLGAMYFASSLILGLQIFSSYEKKDMASIRYVIGVQSFTTGLVASCVLISATIYPYKQDQQIFKMQESSVYANLRVEQTTDEYLSDLKTIGARFGITTKTPIIDNTGYSPGALLALGGLPIGAAWTIGAYRGALAVMNSQLSTYSPECLAQAWILDEQLSEIRIQPELRDLTVLTNIALYLPVARLTNPRSGNEQVLYRPSSASKSGDPCLQGSLP